MADTSAHTDANEIAGLLQEVFVPEITTVRRTCQSCREDHPVGEHLLYKGAGYVLRCPACGDIAACIVVAPERYAMSLHGTWRMAR